MARLLAFCLIAATLASCGPARTGHASLPAGCRMGTAADLRQIQIYADERDVFEAVDPKRAAVTQEPTAASDDPSVDTTNPQFRLSQDDDLGHRNCLAFGWKVVPVGRTPAAAPDFEGKALPSGIAVVPKDGPGAARPVIAALTLPPPLRRVDAEGP